VIVQCTDFQQVFFADRLTARHCLNASSKSSDSVTTVRFSLIVNNGGTKYFMDQLAGWLYRSIEVGFDLRNWNRDRT